MLASQVIDQAGTLRIGEVDDPIAGPGEAVVRVEAAGLAPGAFALLKIGMVPIIPTILGHEIAGVVESVGDPSAAHLVGQRVRVHPLLACGECEYCTTDRDMMCAQSAMIGHALFGPGGMASYSQYHNGGLAEKVLVPVGNLDILPASVSMELGAKAHDFANGIHALKLAELREGSTLIVTAATGAMGVATIALAEGSGVTRVIAVGRDAGRLAKVEELFPSLVTTVTLGEDDDPKSVAGRIRAIEPRGAHAAIDFFPHGKGAAYIFGGLRNGARIVHMGANPEPLVIPPAAFTVACITLVGTRTGTRKDAQVALARLAADPERFEPLITHRFALDEADRARDNFVSRSEPMWMSVVRPQLAQPSAEASRAPLASVPAT